MDILALLIEKIFKDVPYSKENIEARKELERIFEKKYNKLIKYWFSESDALAEIIKKYWDKQKASKLLKIDLLVQANELKPMTLKEIKSVFRKKHIIINTITILIYIILRFLIVLVLQQFTWILLLLTLLFSFVVYLLLRKLWDYRNLSYSHTILDSTSLEYIKQKQSLYRKRLSNWVIIFMLLFWLYVFSIAIIATSISSADSWSLLVYFDTNSWMVLVWCFILIRNTLLVYNYDNLFHKEVSIKYYKYLAKLFTMSFVAWFIGISLYIYTQWLFKFSVNVSTIISLSCLFFIYIYNRNNIKKYLSTKVKINKKRLSVLLSILFLAFLYWFMNLDSWILQPYISTIPNVEHRNLPIVYDENTWVYTIENENNTDFKILQLTDIHLGGSVLSATKDMSAFKAVYNLIEYTKPDLVVVTGDFVFPLWVQSFSFNNYTPLMQFASFMRNINIPWALTYGNHDYEFVASHSEEELIDMFKTFSYKNTKSLLYPDIQADITGRNNQIINIRNKNWKLIQSLFLLDSNSYTGEWLNDYDYIHDDQVEWYEENIKKLKEENKNVASMLFFHIPLKEYRTAYDLYLAGDSSVGYFYWTVWEKDELIACSEYTSKLFEKAVELASTKAIFVGHDHYNNISLEYEGIRLTYGMSIDYLAMPWISSRKEQRWGTLITIHSDSSFDIEPITLSDIVFDWDFRL